MRLLAKLVELDKYYVDKEVGDLYDKDQEIKKQDFKLNFEGINYLNYTIQTSEGMILLDLQMEVLQTTTDLFKVEGDSIMLEFIFNANSGADTYHIKDIDCFGSNTHNITYASNYGGAFSMQPGTNVSFFIIILSKAFYFQLVPAGLKLHEEFSRKISQQQNCMLFGKHVPVTPAMHALIYEIRHCNRAGELKRLYIENKIQELLLLQLEMQQQHFVMRSDAGLSDDDIDKLIEAKKILDNEYLTSPGISEISKRIYLNEFKLKKGYKMCFGVTIKSYVISLKMKYAMQLIKEEKYRISEIAYMSGYHGLVQFSTAFKSYFGCSPKAIMASKRVCAF